MNSFQSVSDARPICDRLAAGLIAATPVPFDKNGLLHEAGHESYLRYMVRQPIAGVAVWAHTGRGLMLDSRIAARVLHDWRNALPERVIVAGVGSQEPNFEGAIARTVEMAERGASLGATAVICYPPTWLRGHSRADQLIVEHHIRVAEVG